MGRDHYTEGQLATAALHLLDRRIGLPRVGFDRQPVGVAELLDIDPVSIAQLKRLNYLLSIDQTDTRVQTGARAIVTPPRPRAREGQRFASNLWMSDQCLKDLIGKVEVDPHPSDLGTALRGAIPYRLAAQAASRIQRASSDLPSLR